MNNIFRSECNELRKILLVMFFTEEIFPELISYILNFVPDIKSVVNFGKSCKYLHQISTLRLNKKIEGDKVSIGNKTYGEYVRWFINRDGTLTKILHINFDNGKYEGSYKEWFPTGKVKCEAIMKNGMKHGLYIEYDEKGRKIIKGNYYCGFPHGTISRKKKLNISTIRVRNGIIETREEKPCNTHKYTEVWDHGIIVDRINYVGKSDFKKSNGSLFFEKWLSIKTKI